MIETGNKYIYIWGNLHHRPRPQYSISFYPWLLVGSFLPECNFYPGRILPTLPMTSSSHPMADDFQNNVTTRSKLKPNLRN